MSTGKYRGRKETFSQLLSVSLFITHMLIIKCNCHMPKHINSGFKQHVRELSEKIKKVEVTAMAQIDMVSDSVL